MKKNDYLLTSLNYFTQGMWTTFISTYLALYLLFNTNNTRGEIAIFFSIVSLPLLLRPWLGKMIDRSAQIRMIFTVGIVLYFGSILTMSLLIVVPTLVAKIIPLFLAYLGIAILDSVGDKYMTAAAKGNATSSAIWMSLAQIIARSVLTLGYARLIGTDITTQNWSILILLLGVSSLPLAIFGVIKYPVYITPHSVPIEEKGSLTPAMKKSIRLIILLAIILNLNKLADIVLEPYIFTKFGSSEFILYTSVVTFAAYLNFITYPLIYKFKSIYKHCLWKIHTLLL